MKNDNDQLWVVDVSDLVETKPLADERRMNQASFNFVLEHIYVGVLTDPVSRIENLQR